MPATATDNIEVEIDGLRHLDLDALRLRWRTAFRRTAPAHLPRHLLLRLLAYRLQAQALGDINKETERFLDQLTRQSKGNSLSKGNTSDGKNNTVMAVPAKEALAPGTLLIRDHDGARHQVMVLEDGFAWSGNIYPSLSKVALAITGTNWNGPRFFGLRDQKRARS
ncbi:MAG: DUF2924 domain-containing protein [Parvibaculum sp.]|nr:DUF2924 domain-containing protein [Parvibaculum sp.]